MGKTTKIIILIVDLMSFITPVFAADSRRALLENSVRIEGHLRDRYADEYRRSFESQKGDRHWLSPARYQTEPYLYRVTFYDQTKKRDEHFDLWFTNHKVPLEMAMSRRDIDDLMQEYTALIVEYIGQRRPFKQYNEEDSNLTDGCYVLSPFVESGFMLTRSLLTIAEEELSLAALIKDTAIDSSVRKEALRKKRLLGAFKDNRTYWVSSLNDLIGKAGKEKKLDFIGEVRADLERLQAPEELTENLVAELNHFINWSDGLSRNHLKNMAAIVFRVLPIFDFDKHDEKSVEHGVGLLKKLNPYVIDTILAHHFSQTATPFCMDSELIDTSKRLSIPVYDLESPNDQFRVTNNILGGSSGVQMLRARSSISSEKLSERLRVYLNQEKKYPYQAPQAFDQRIHSYLAHSFKMNDAPEFERASILREALWMSDEPYRLIDYIKRIPKPFLVAVGLGHAKRLLAAMLNHKDLDVKTIERYSDGRWIIADGQDLP